MKKILSIMLSLMLLLSGCSLFTQQTDEPTTPTDDQTTATDTADTTAEPIVPEEELVTVVESTQATIYLPNDTVEYMVPTTVEIVGDVDFANALVEQLIAHNALPEGTAVLSWDETTGVLDLNDVYGTAVSSTGTAGETMLIYAVVNTFLDNFEVAELTLTAEGNMIETGHTIYDFSFTKISMLAPE